MKTKLAIAITTLLLFLICAAIASPQKQPDAKRVREIQQALRANGYDPGRTWAETQSVCRGIAATHHWQVQHAPDARVLILIGLGNKYSDDAVLNERSRLDRAEKRTK